MKKYIISLLLLFGLAPKADACLDENGNYHCYMFCYQDNTFRSNFDEATQKFWKDYCKTDYAFESDMLDAAKKKNDVEMQSYLSQLSKYTDICNEVQELWSYPTAAELAARKSTLRSVVAACQSKLRGKYGSRWALLSMRANMLLNNHQANIAFWNNIGKNYRDDCYKDMMKNIYARDLLLTGKKKQAWNIYAEQNDQQSLLWSVRKFTNLAGIKSLCEEDVNAPVLNYLVQTFVNRIQSLIEEDEGTFSCVYPDNVIWGKAYAQLGADRVGEYRGFVAYASQIARGGKTQVPCMWMSAAALVNYFMHDYKAAKTCIDEAMLLNGTPAMKDNARRIRMLIEPTVANLQSNDFQNFMVQELRWLDSKVQENRDNRDWCVRQKIISIGLSNEFARRNNKNMVLAFDALCDYHNNAFDWNGNKLSECYDYSSKSFSAIDHYTSDEIIAYFKSVKQPANTPLAKYVSEKLMQQYSEDYINDVIGTKLLAENKLAEAIPYLKKVSQRYIDNQTIAYYVAHRDYKTPAWYGQQKIDAEEYDDNGNKIVYPLNGNVKVNFCNDVIALQNKFAIADFDVRKQLAYQLAGYYYQASFKGQC
ncbi:MAG: hypothetical protein HUK05_03095, partial [Prevotella sp.]|nr:hypothetical protein [Prevotella sp.]